MPRGPKPAQAAVREQKQAVRSKRAKPEVAQAEVVVRASPQPPEWLKAEALGVWSRLAPSLSAAKLLSPADAGAFARYCRNFAKWEELRTKLDEAGYTYESTSAHGNLRRVDPDFMVADRIERQLLAAEDRFGLNPAERQRIMAARSQSGVVGDLLEGAAPPQRSPRPDDPAALPSQPAVGSPIGVLTRH